MRLKMSWDWNSILCTILILDSAVNVLLQFIVVFHTKRTVHGSHSQLVLIQTALSLLCHCLLRTLLKASLTVENSRILLLCCLNALILGGQSSLSAFLDPCVWTWIIQSWVTGMLHSPPWSSVQACLWFKKVFLFFLKCVHSLNGLSLQMFTVSMTFPFSSWQFHCH